MQIAARWASSTLTIDLTPEGGDQLQWGHARLAGREARFVLPVPIGPGDVHPDIEALLGLLMTKPFTRSIVVARGVSKAFADSVALGLRIGVGPVDPSLEPRQPPEDGVVGLAFSGGADSTAALEVLPASTVACFMRRIDPPDGARRSTYSDEAALHACAELERRGRRVHIVETDMEHVRQPVGFTTDWINGAGPLLLADVERFDGLAWGLIAESAYRIGSQKYEDWALRQVPWATVFAAVGLPMCSVTAGVSEIGTSAIVRASPYADIAQSCILRSSQPREPCLRCWKCFRKSMLDAAQTGVWPDNAAIDGMLSSKAVRKKLADFPIKHEDVVAWTMSRYPGDHPVLRLLARRTRASEQDLDWLTRYYGPSIDLLPDARQAEVRTRLEGYLAPMTPADEEQMRAWDLRPTLADPAAIAAHAELVRMLRPYGPPPRPLYRRILSGIRHRLPG